MKRLSLVFRLISGVLVALVATVFAVLEATLVVTLDFNLYENELVALLQLLLKLLIAVSAGALGVLSIVKRTRSFLPEGLCLLVASVVMIPFVSNGFGIYIAAVSVFFVLSQLLFAKG